MNLKKWSPWNWFKHEGEQQAKSVPVEVTRRAEHPLMQLHQEMDRLFGDAFRGFGLGTWPRLGDIAEKMMPFRPHLDIKEGKDNYTITVEIPGVDEKDVQIELDDDVLRVRGEKKQESEEKAEDFHRIERVYGAFERVLNLPVDADSEHIDAHFKKGVLTITIGKREGSRAAGRRIEIESG